MAGHQGNMPNEGEKITTNWIMSCVRCNKTKISLELQIELICLLKREKWKSNDKIRRKYTETGREKGEGRRREKKKGGGYEKWLILIEKFILQIIKKLFLREGIWKDI